jgi:hypothetical protein
MRTQTAPTVAFVNSLASWVWLERTAAGPVAFLLLAHPDGGSAPVRQELERLALALGLDRPARRLTDVGKRLAVIGGSHAVVRIDGCDHMVRVEVGAGWAEFVASGGPVAMTVGLAPLVRCAPRRDVQRYLAVSTMRGRLRVGLAESVGSFTDSELR